MLAGGAARRGISRSVVSINQSIKNCTRNELCRCPASTNRALFSPSCSTLSTNSRLLEKRTYSAAAGQKQEEKVEPVPESERDPLPAHASPSTVYDYKVKYHDLNEDVHQREVITRFQALYEKMGTYRPSTNSSIFNFLFPGPSSKRWGSGGGGSNVPKGIYLWGTVGGGKTMLMDMFYDTLEGLDPEIKKVRIHYYDFMQSVHTRMHEAKKSAPPRDISKWDTYQPFDPVPPVGDKILEESYILCLDEFQVTDIADAMILRQLFAYLFDKGLILVATSNRPPRDLYKNGIQRSNFIPFIDMLQEKSYTVSLDPGIDYRRKALGGSEKLFFVTTNPEHEAEASLDGMFKFLAAQETDMVKETTIRIKGRDVHFNKSCGGVLDASFHELCERALWTNDYLKLTQVYHTILIRDIPILSQQNKSESRRFICLIDTLYDHKIRVVASGVANYWDLFQNASISDQDRLDANRMLIDDLGIKAADTGSLDSGVFSGEEELFAFDRTVSRLTEMQTKDYWKKWKTHMENR